MRTHYDNLQVKENASLEVIKGAYKHLSQKWHPDKHLDNREEAERILKILNEAYEILSDPEKRKSYDERIKNRRNNIHNNQSNNNAKDSDDSIHEKFKEWDATQRKYREMKYEENKKSKEVEGNNSIHSTTKKEHAPIVGMRWYKTWTYVFLPLRGASDVVFGLMDFHKYGIDFSFGALMLCVAFGLHAKKSWAWGWNLIVIAYIYLTTIFLFSQQADLPLDQIFKGSIAAVVMAIVWLWPNYLYWNNRISLFIGENKAEKTSVLMRLCGLIFLLLLSYVQWKEFSFEKNSMTINGKVISAPKEIEEKSSINKLLLAAGIQQKKFSFQYEYSIGKLIYTGVDEGGINEIPSGEFVVAYDTRNPRISKAVTDNFSSWSWLWVVFIIWGSLTPQIWHSFALRQQNK